MQKYSVNQHLIETLLTWVKSGEIAIPEIQRPFVWDATQVRNLLDSIYQGYPVGYLIAWRNPTVKPVRLLAPFTPTPAALLLSDTISSLASMEYKMDAWGIDLTVGGSQKGLMLPTGMSMTGVSNKALEVDGRKEWPKGYSCIAEKRAIETILDGKPSTAFMKYGDTIRIEMKGKDGQSVFGAIDQKIAPPRSAA